jgi:acetylglutamate kinase
VAVTTRDVGMDGAAPKTVVVKVGGDVLLDEQQRTGLGRNVKDLVDRGCTVAILHGGGPQVSALQERVGLQPKKIAGRRVTSKEDLVVVTQAICGEVNVGLVSTLLAAGVPAFGTHGASCGLILADKRPPQKVKVEKVNDKGEKSEKSQTVDFGEVGDVVEVDAELVTGLFDLGVVPVIATLGVDVTGRVFNINADTTAVHLAKALNADLLLMVTAVGGVFANIDDPKTRIATLTPKEGKKLIKDGVITGGMIPKVEEALSILDDGVGAVAILNAQHEGAFTSALDGDGARGTRFARA